MNEWIAYHVGRRYDIAVLFIKANDAARTEEGVQCEGWNQGQLKRHTTLVEPKETFYYLLSLTWLQILQTKLKLDQTVYMSEVNFFT